MKYIEFTVNTTDQAEELVCDILEGYSNFGVVVLSMQEVIELTQKRANTFDYIDEKLLSGDMGVSLVKAYFDLDKAEEYKSLILQDFERLKQNSAGFLDVGTLKISEREVDGDDWIRVWREHYKPINFGKITVCPRWIECDKNDYIVYIDSNQAFGTGEHETTSMCVEFLEKYVSKDMTVVDVGTGSGILGISAAKLGAKSVTLTDIDPVAVDAAKHNTEINNVDNICKVYNTNLLEGIKIEGDIVVANITADVLKILATNICSYVKEKGIIILSGILNDRKDEVLYTYENLGFKLLDLKSIGEWTCLTMTR